ncbi:hypothetical protein ACL9RF_05005 [Sphingobacterium sp. Mn56C]|uniref:hypothetical protein n=1 Tax=Sphingobacterium sp. Mn56C TaxID=3395261 RepID=UPI003BE871DD
MKKKKPNTVKKPEFARPVEQYFYELDQVFTQGNKGLYALLLAFAFFGVMGIIWMIPFPQFEFMVKMNAHTFLNWGSFFIAIVVYLYLRLAPTLSYAILLCIGVMSFFIVQLEYIERDGGPAVLLVSLLLALSSITALWFIANKESKFTPKDFKRLLTIGPIWLWSKVFEKVKLRY